ncbi:MAG: Rne/Rng family ribonuclease [Firmicutes bacterium]|nr:Rne/Rng family ribonuclease [Bacillota bacterium]
MSVDIIINVSHSEKRAAFLEDGRLMELFIERTFNERVAGNIYKGRVENVLPGMQAAFVNIGLERNAFLYVEDALVGYDEDLPDELQSSKKKKPTINEVLKVGQEIVVQITKEPIGTKGARVVTNLTLPGRYLVLMPSVNYVGVSRRIEDQEERERLKKIAEKIKPRNMGVIVRTAAEGQVEKNLKRDVKYLLKTWDKIQKKAGSVKAPALLHKDYDLVSRIVRDHFGEDVNRLVVDSSSEYDRIREMLSTMSPKLRRRVSYFHSSTQIFDYYGIEPQIEKALKRKVWLDCGGYLVIDETEALVSIDVNTGKYIGKTDKLSDTVLKTNLDAAKEIARQLRLRNMAGIIIVDFIDMDSDADRQKVLNLLQEEIKKDKVKTNIVGFTQLGLVEITRKKVKRDLDETLQKTCPYCDGVGRILSEETVAINAERRLIGMLANRDDVEAVLVNAHPQVAALLIGSGGANLKRLEEETGRTIFIKGNQALHLTDVQIIAGSVEEIKSKAIPVREGQRLELLVEEPHVTNPKDGIARVEGYVVDVLGGGELVGKKVEVEIIRAFRTYAKGKIIQVIGEVTDEVDTRIAAMIE